MASLNTSGVNVHPKLQSYCQRAGVNEKTIQRIVDIRRSLGKNLFFVAHQYQRPEICYLADFIGDSYALALKASQSNAQYILYSGVRFMADSSAAMARADQKVFHPRPLSGCPLANDVKAGDLQKELETVQRATGGKTIVPFTYMNSDLATKAVIGKWGGAVVTSANAAKILSQEFHHGHVVFFVPDQNLGMNIALRELGLTKDDFIIWDPKNPNYNEAELAAVPLFLWKGRCRVHAKQFRMEHIEHVREEFPLARIVVHPECTPEVVEQADANGSTAFIVSYARSATAESPIFIGTELNLISRLRFEDPNLFPLAESICGNMDAITPNHLLKTLEGIASGRFINEVTVDSDMTTNANLALQRMIDWVAD